MRITYLADIRLPLERANGIQTMETCHALGERGHEVTLITRPDTARPPRDPYVYYGLPRTGRLLIEQAPVTGPELARRLGYLSFAAGRSIGHHRADALLTRDLGVAALLARMPATLRPPFVYESHGYAPTVSAELPDLIATAKRPSARKLARLAAREALVWRAAEGYVAITQALSSQLAGELGARPNLAVIPDGVRLTSGRSWLPAPAGPPLVGYAGHLYAWKGVDILLEALALTPTLGALIVGGLEGEPDLARVRGRADVLGMSGRVEITGQLPPPAVAAALNRASILVLPNLPTVMSSRFTSPLKMFEYMAAGRAIVASDLPAIREVLRHEGNALLVEAGNAAALAAGISRLAADRELADRLARSAFDEAAQFGWDARAARVEAVLERARVP